MRRLLGVASLSLMLGLMTFASHVTARCGVERWSVKTGTDPDAAMVNLATLTPTTISALSALTAPHPIPANTRVGPAETTVWTVDATLVKFKIEDDPTTGDSDYHLVLRDPAGHTMIAEIPSPGCVEQASLFRQQIVTARSTFDARYTVVSQFTPANIPVRVRGVGFFDFAHGQVGHAPNFIELHPVLGIEFNPSGPPTPPTPTPTPAPTPQPAGSNELIADGGFEDATQGGATAPGWTSTISPAGQHVIIAQGSYPHSGANYAFMGSGNNLESTLEQTVSIPAGTSSAVLTFWVNVVTKENSSASARDRLKVEIHDASGALLTTPLTLSNRQAPRSNNSPGKYFQSAPIGLAGHAGETIKLVFHATSDSARPTVFRIDDVSLKTGP